MQFSMSGDPGRRRFFLKIEPGEEVIGTLSAFARKQGITGASLSGIGALRETELGWYDTEECQYLTEIFPENLELLSLTGNLSCSGDRETVHAHALCASRTLSAVGGHLVKATCAVTVEVTVVECGFPLNRAHDETFDLALLDLPDRL